MGYSALVVLAVACHFFFIAVAVFGGLAVARYPRFAWIHIPIFFWAGFILLTPWTCPLTALETFARRHAQLSVYSDGFVAHYIHPAIQALGLGRAIPYLGFFVLGLNAIIYTTLLLRHHRRRRSSPPSAGVAPD